MLQMLGHYRDPQRNYSVLGKCISSGNLSLDSTWTWEVPEQLQFWGILHICPALGTYWCLLLHRILTLIPLLTHYDYIFLCSQIFATLHESPSKSCSKRKISSASLNIKQEVLPQQKPNQTATQWNTWVYVLDLPDTLHNLLKSGVSDQKEGESSLVQVLLVYEEY